MIFETARAWDYIHKNPTEHVKKPRVDKKEVEIPSGGDIDAILATAKGQTKLLVLTAICTGMRAGELMALRWRAVDLVEGLIHVKSNYVRGHFDTPKSKASKRSIVIPSILVDSLARAKERSEYELVFANSKGGPLEWKNFISRSFHPLLREAGVPRIKFHALRHYYASTQLGAENPDFKFIQAQLGHGGLVQTLDVYGHVIKKRPDSMRQKIQDALMLDPRAVGVD